MTFNEDDGGEWVTRYDVGAIQMSSPVVTPDGFLKVTGYASRTGIFEYLNPDGSIRRELRLPEDVFSPDSLASYEGVPLTARHPGYPVTPANVRGLAVGTVLSPAEQASDGEHVAIRAVVTDGGAIDDLRKGRLRELSSGYRLKLDRTAGVHPDWGAYDARQRMISINHLAMVEQARAGKTARFKLDSRSRVYVSDAMRFDSAELGPSAAVMIIGGNVEDAHVGFKKLVKKLAARPGVTDPKALAATIGREKYGAKAMASKAAAGKRDALPAMAKPADVTTCMQTFGGMTFEPGGKRAAFNRIVARAKALGVDPAGFIKKWGTSLDSAAAKPTEGSIMADRKGGTAAPQKPSEVDANVAATEIARERKRADDAEATLAEETKRADAADGQVKGLEKQIKELQDAQIDPAQVDELNVKIEQLETELAAEKKRADDAEDPARIKAAVKSRVALEKVASAILDTTDFDNLDDRELMTLVIDKRGGEVTAEHTDEHVRGQFEALVKNFKRGAESLARLRQIATPVNADGTKAQARSARDQYLERQRNSWQPKATRSGKEG